MNCQQFESRIHALLDERQDLRGDMLLTAHQLRCPECQEKLLAFEAIENYFQSSSQSDRQPAPMAKVSWAPVKSVRASKRTSHSRRWAFVAVAAALLAMVVPLIDLGSRDLRTPLAERGPVSQPTEINAMSAATEVPWPQVLATIEDLPRRLEELGPVYIYTAQMTGVSSITSSLNLTVDLLRLQLGGLPPLPREPLDDSQGFFERTCTAMQTA